MVAHFQAPYLFLTTDPTGHNVNNLNWIGATDAALYRRVDRPLVVAGHLPDPTRPFDVAVNELAAGQHHLHVGSRFHLYAYSAAQFQHGGLTNASEIGTKAPAGPSFTVRVTAIVRFPQDVNAIQPLAAKRNVSYEAQQNAYLTPAFLPRLSAGLGIPVQEIPEINLVGVRLRHGAADWKPFAAAATAVGNGQIFTSAGNVYGIRTAASSAERGIHLEVVALLLFGALAALVTLLLVGQAIARQVMRKPTTTHVAQPRRHPSPADGRRHRVGGGDRHRWRRARLRDRRAGITADALWPGPPSRDSPRIERRSGGIALWHLLHRLADRRLRHARGLAGESAFSCHGARRYC